MSQIDIFAANAFYHFESFKRDNTHVFITIDPLGKDSQDKQVCLKLYTNVIAWCHSIRPQYVYFDICGFNTATTRARLKAICERFAVGKTVYVSKGKLQLFGNYWNGKPVKIDVRNPTEWEYV
jgi:hypothetical protein